MRETILLNQHGFLKGKCCPSAQKDLRDKASNLQTLYGKDDSIILLFVDIEDAYGSVHWDIMFKLIKDLGFWN